jgi:hypothetical protein
MITLTREEAQELLNALTYVGDAKDIYSDTIDMLRSRLAQPEPEPVAKIVLTETIGLPCLRWLDLTRQFDFKGGEFLYTTPPQREWHGLTKDEINNWDLPNSPTVYEFAQFVEAKLKEKNT